MQETLHELRKAVRTGEPETIAEVSKTLYEEAVGMYKKGNIPGAREMVTEALKVLENTPETDFQMAEFQTALSDFNYILGYHREALLSSFAAADHYRKADCTDEEIRARANCGGLLLNFGVYSEAYEQLLKGQSMAEEHGMPVQEAQCRLNIAFILQNRGEYALAIEELERADTLFEAGGYTTGRGFCLDRLADIRRKKGEYHKALLLHEEALRIKSEDGLAWEKLMLTANYGTTLIMAGKPDEAQELCQRILGETEGEESPDYRAQIHTVEAKALLALGLPDRALESIDTAEALFSRSQGGQEDRNELMKLRAEALKQKGMADQAYSSLREFLERSEELRDREKKKELAEMRIVTEVKTALQKDTISAKNRELEEANSRLIKALEQVQALSGMLPICPSCKRIRDDAGYWQQIESYISSHSTAQFSHSLCSDCLRKHYPDFDSERDES